MCISTHLLLPEEATCVFSLNIPEYPRPLFKSEYRLDSIVLPDDSYCTDTILMDLPPPQTLSHAGLQWTAFSTRSLDSHTSLLTHICLLSSKILARKMTRLVDHIFQHLYTCMLLWNFFFPPGKPAVSLLYRPSRMIFLQQCLSDFISVQIFSSGNNQTTKHNFSY